MQLFTVILDFRGGTYISQVRAPDVVGAVKAWAEHLDWRPISYMGQSSYDALCSSLRTEEPTPLEGLQSAWCVTALLPKGLALINIVTTVDDG